MVRTRGVARGTSEAVLDEVVDDAIRVVVMMRKPILSEEHLMGAFWATARLLLHQHREGRHGIRLGGLRRFDFEEVARSLVADDPEVEEVLISRDRAARAVDLMSQLSSVEREVFAVMAVQRLGIKATARTLGLPLKRVKAAQRSARGKLDRVAVVATAGRMCGYRQASVIAYAHGSASPEQEQVAQAHIVACSSCRGEYARLVREMRKQAFQRDSVAAYLPALFLSLDRHVGVVPRLLGWLVARPRVGSERALEALGGVGAVKVAAAGSAVVVATVTLAGVPAQTLLSRPPAHLHHHNVTRSDARRTRRPAVSPSTAAASVPRTPTLVRPVLTPKQRAALEFSSVGPRRRSSAGATEGERGTVAGVEATASSQEIHPSVTKGGRHFASSGGALKAAREFGQP